MVQSVQRALTLLELLDAGGVDGRMLTDLCVGSGLKAPTAHNLLGTLVELGYAQQDSGTRRYVIGERARSLGSGQAVVARLKHVATVPVRELHAQANETVILAVDLDEQRHSILCCESEHELRVTAAPGRDDHFYDTATGRVLLALRTAQDARAFAEQHGLPGAAWPEAATAAGFAQALATIRGAGHAELSKSPGHVRALAVPIRLLGCPLRAALGLFYPTVRDAAGRRDDLLKRLHDAARQIEDAYERT